VNLAKDGRRRENLILGAAGRQRDEARSVEEEAPSSEEAVQWRALQRCCKAATLRPGSKANFSSSPHRGELPSPGVSPPPE
jgi:hypothetical protein